MPKGIRATREFRLKVAKTYDKWVKLGLTRKGGWSKEVNCMDMTRRKFPNVPKYTILMWYYQQI